jgi:HlyD family secretion protein
MKMHRWKQFLLLPLVALVGCGHGSGHPVKSRSDRLPRVEVVQPTRGPLMRKIELAATVVPLQQADLAARVPGTIDWMPPLIDIGRPVRKDEELLHLAVPDLQADKKQKEAMREQIIKQVEQTRQAAIVAHKEAEEAEQQLKKYAADLAFQQGRYERILSLVKMGAQDRSVSEEEKRKLDTAVAAVNAGQATIASRKAKADAADAEMKVTERKVEVARTEVEKLSKLISFATIRAPFDGVITRRWVDQGATIKDAGAPLLTVMQLHRVRVLLDIPQREVPLIDAVEGTTMGKADQVVVRIPALGEFRGAVTRLGKALDPVTRTMRAEVELDNPRGYLRPGMYGKAEVQLDERSNILTVPATALVKRGEGKVGVYIVENPKGVPPEGTLKFVELETGLDDGKRVEVRKGLSGNEMVVARGNGVLHSGDEVRALPQKKEE